MVFETIQIDLYSPPPAEEAPEPTPPPSEELVVESPIEDSPPPEVAEPESPSDTPPPEPEPDRPLPETEPEEAEPEQPRGPEPEPSDLGGEDIEVRMEGLRRDYPQYYERIVTQIERCFRPPRGGRWETVVYFVIERDGTVSDLRFVRQSGNASFDFQALGAVECASGRFGPLPEDLPMRNLPIQFSFRPAGAVGGDNGRGEEAR